MRGLDIFIMSLSAIRTNKLRSFLTLTGIVLGVASIIGVMTAMTVVQHSMEKELSVLGAQTFQLQKWPNGFASQAQRMAAMKWPPVTLDEADAIREQVKNIDNVGTEFWDGGKVISANGYTTEPKISVVGGSAEYSENNAHYIELGRNLSRMDMLSSAKVAIISHSLAEELFPFADPIGKIFRADGRKLEVVGVFEKKDSSMGGPYESMILMPGTTFTSIYGETDGQGFRRSANVTVHARSVEVVPDAIEEVRQLMRRLRHLKAGEDDNFSYFTSQSSIDNFNKATAGVKIGAFLMGGIALIVAGIGIMNIMLVAVTERTKEIGIRKSLGAKRRDILLQFLIEAIVLCNAGGVICISLGVGIGNVIALMTGMDSTIPIDWVIYGITFCTFIGVTFGMLPAIKASKLNPVEALRYE
jgi:putative ABC transport system permease protein